MDPTNTQVRLASRPCGPVEESNFRVEEAAIPPIAEGEFLVRNHWLSLDPYMRGRMNDTKSYAASVELGQIMVGATAGEVVESRHPGFLPGELVIAQLGWVEYGVSNGAGVLKVDTTRVPLSAYLGVVGVPGVTAYVGLFDIGLPKAGQISPTFSTLRSGAKR